MINRMLIIVLLFASVCESFADGQVLRAKKPVTRPVRIAMLVKQLGSHRFSDRRIAETQLVQFGTDAVQPLLETSQNGSHESRRRALQVLEKVYRNPQTTDEIAELIDQGFDSLLHSSNASIAQLTKRIVFHNLLVRRQRALSKIEKMGGVIRYYGQHYPTYYNREKGLSQNERAVRFILVGTNWRGGDEGVKYLKRIPDLSVIYIASSKKTKPLSNKAIDEIKLERPEIEFQMRGTACLGVTASTLAGDSGCRISDVEKSSAASEAGIKSGDLVVSFDGVEISSFEKFVKLIGEHDPGEKIKMKIMRKQEKIDTEIVLHQWEQ